MDGKQTVIRWWNNLPYVPVYDWPLTDKRHILEGFGLERRGEVIDDWTSSEFSFIVDMEKLATYPLPPLKEWLG